MKTVYKYPLTDPRSALELPRKAVILTVHSQGGQVCLWALVDPDDKRTETRYFATFGTGHCIDDDLVQGIYLGTAFVGALVWHVFEV